MYYRHDLFKDIPDNTTIWRYLDLASFLFLIENSSLHFSRLDKLEDKFEGSLGVINIKAREEELKRLPEVIRGISLRSSIKNNEEHCKCIFVNCWSINSHESAAFWKTFSTNNSLAIRSNIGKLKESFNKDDKNAVLLSPINYIDYKKEAVEGRTATTPYTFKRKSFEYENEIRALIIKYPSKSKNGSPISYDPFLKKENTKPEGYDIIYELNLNENGIDAHVDLSALIEEVYISPSSPEWFLETMQKVVRNKKLSFKIKKSSLDDPALY